MRTNRGTAEAMSYLRRGLALALLPPLWMGVVSHAAPLAWPVAATVAAVAAHSFLAPSAEANSVTKKETKQKKKQKKTKKRTSGCWRGNRRYREGEAYVPDPRLRIGFKGTLVCRGGEWVLVPLDKSPNGNRKAR